MCMKKLFLGRAKKLQAFPNYPSRFIPLIVILTEKSLSLKIRNEKDKVHNSGVRFRDER